LPGLAGAGEVGGADGRVGVTVAVVVGSDFTSGLGAATTAGLGSLARAGWGLVATAGLGASVDLLVASSPGRGRGSGGPEDRAAVCVAGGRGGAGIADA
jgi:hypothetical protein